MFRGLAKAGLFVITGLVLIGATAGCELEIPASDEKDAAPQLEESPKEEETKSLGEAPPTPNATKQAEQPEPVPANENIGSAEEKSVVIQYPTSTNPDIVTEGVPAAYFEQLIVCDKVDEKGHCTQHVPDINVRVDQGELQKFYVTFIGRDDNDQASQESRVISLTEAMVRDWDGKTSHRPGTVALLTTEQFVVKGVKFRRTLTVELDELPIDSEKVYAVALMSQSGFQAPIYIGIKH